MENKRIIPKNSNVHFIINNIIDNSCKTYTLMEEISSKVDDIQSRETNYNKKLISKIFKYKDSKKDSENIEEYKRLYKVCSDLIKSDKNTLIDYINDYFTA